MEGKPAESGVTVKSTQDTNQSQTAKPIAKEESKDAANAKSKYPSAMPKIRMNLKYKPMPQITQCSHYIYNVPKVYEDSLNFNWKDKDYLISSDDRRYLKWLNS